MKCQCDELRDKIRNMTATFRNDCNDALTELITLRASLEAAEKELKMYKQALTKAVSLPAKELPNTEQWYTWNNNGNVEVATR